MIPLMDLVAQYVSIKQEIDEAIQEVLTSGKFILGPNEKAFENEIAEYLGVKYAIGVASGTDALIIALRAAKIGPGDEVIVPAYSFFATAGAVLSVGAIPCFVDISPDTYLINVSQIENAISPLTKAIVPVHLYGQSADMDNILFIAKTHNLFVIEDNAQAFGCEYKAKKTSSLGDLGCLSFFPSKNLGGYGDGGMVVTNDEQLAEQVRMLRTHGWKKKYFPEVLGYNSRLDEIQAAVLRVKLKYVDKWNAQRRKIAKIYDTEFSRNGLCIPIIAQDQVPVYHLYIVASPEREKIMNGLKNVGIASEIYYPIPLHLTDPLVQSGRQFGKFPISEKASKEVLAIPLYPEMTEEQIWKVVNEINLLLSN